MQHPRAIPHMWPTDASCIWKITSKTGWFFRGWQQWFHFQSISYCFLMLDIHAISFPQNANEKLINHFVSFQSNSNRLDYHGYTPAYRWPCVTDRFIGISHFRKTYSSLSHRLLAYFNEKSPTLVFVCCDVDIAETDHWFHPKDSSSAFALVTYSFFSLLRWMCFNRVWMEQQRKERKNLVISEIGFELFVFLETKKKKNELKWTKEKERKERQRKTGFVERPPMMEQQRNFILISILFVFHFSSSEKKNTNVLYSSSRFIKIQFF